MLAGTDRAHPSLVAPLVGSCLPTRLVGAKAAALDRVVRLGLAVPTSFAVTTAAYDTFVTEGRLSGFLRRLATDEAGIGDDEIDETFRAIPLPERLTAELATAVCGAHGGRWAVRSSATAEDLAGASFAGQYLSLLNVATDDLAVAVRDVWASLWHEAPRRYRWFQGIGHDDIEMGVLVMQMLRPDHAGVMFTSDPLAGQDDVTRIEVVEGLGEALVSGTATPTVVQVSEDGNPLGPHDDGYWFVDDLRTAGRRLEHEFGAAQDVEWATEAGRLHILQARPITTGEVGDPLDDGFDTHPGDDRPLSTAGIAEMLPGHLPPRLWSLNRRAVDDGFRSLFDALGADGPWRSDPDAALVRRCRGRAVIDLDLLHHAVRSVPGSSVERLDEQYFGASDVPSNRTAAPKPDDRPSPATALRQGARNLRARSAAALDSEIVIQTVDALLDAEPVLAELTDADLVALRARLEHVAGRVVAAEIQVAAMAAAAFDSVEHLLARHLPADAATETARTLTSLHDLDGESVLSSLADLAGTATARPLVDAVDMDWPTADAHVGSSTEGRNALDEFRRRLRRAGSAAVFGGATWEESPELGWAVFCGLVRRGSQVPRAEAIDVGEIEDALTHSPSWRRARALHGHAVDVRLHFLRREASEAGMLLARRESTKAALFRLGGIVRRVDLEIGRRLTRQARLEEAADVDLVASHEFTRLFDGDGPPPAELARRRRRASAAADSPPLPRRFSGTPETEPPPTPSGGVVTGRAASRGRHRGVGRVVTDPARHRIRRGDVLVARNTDASWSPLFMLAGAIVVEEGGPLSHAAIIARELDIPAVMGVAGIVELVAAAPSTVRLTVDGSAGTVAIETDGHADAEPATMFHRLVPPREPPAVTKPIEPRLSVFVTGLIGASALMSAVFALTEAAGGHRAQRRLGRRARPIADMTAHATVSGYDATVRDPVGLASRRTYGWLAAALALVGGFLAAESTEAYLDGSAGGFAALIWAAALLSGVQLLAFATLAGTAAGRWPHVPLTVRRIPFLVERGRRHRHRVDTAALAAGLLAAGFVALLAINLWAPSALAGVDERLYDAIGASAENDRIGPDWLRWFGQPRVVIPVALAIGIVAARCRVLAIAIPVSIMTAGIANALLWWIVDKERPWEGIHAGRHDSFPGGHAITVTLLFGLIPLAARAVTSRRWVVGAVTVASTVVMVILLVDQVRQGGHWPTDQLAGFLLGASGVVAVYGLVGSRSAHYRCSSCPWVEDRTPPS